MQIATAVTRRAGCGNMCLSRGHADDSAGDTTTMHHNDADEEHLPAQLVGGIRDAVVTMARGDQSATLAALAQVYPYGHDGLFAACVAWADAVAVFTGLESGSEQFAELMFVGPQGQLHPGTLPEDAQAIVWAAQFVTAHLNDDVETEVALYKAHCNAVHLGSYVWQLLCMAVGAYLRAMPEEQG